MSLFSQEKVESSLEVYTIYIYIIVGGLGSLLMLFLIRQSLPFNKQKIQKYQQTIQIAKQEVFKLEKELLKSKYFSLQVDNQLDLQIDTTNTAFDNLQEIPDFFTDQEKIILKSKLETQGALLASQSKLIEQLQNAETILIESCLYIPKLKNELVANPGMLGRDLLSDSQLVLLVNDLLSNSVLYCYGTEDDLRYTIESQIRNIDLLLKQEEFTKYKFIVAEFINYGKIVVRQKQEINNIFSKIDSIDLNEKLQEVEIDYLNQYQQSLGKINTYRILSSLFFSAIIIFVAYKIISNLVRTNRGIVKVLEGFTKELETKVEQRTAQLEESIQNTEAALTQAQNANKAKSRFLANMSHELRTPLNAILGFTQLMSRDSSISYEHQENLQIINRSGEHLLKLINDILEMSKIEVGQITLNEVKFDLYKMLKSIEDMLSLKAEAKNLKLTFNIAKNVPKYINTDEGKLRQIIINLLGNALKFTQRGAVTLTVKLKDNSNSVENKIDFLFSDTYSLNFAVEDTGSGIEAEEMEGLFSPFEQTKIGRISNEGTGLGLSISQKFVALMGGEIKVSSVVGQGSIFSFEILIRLQDKVINQSIDETEINQAHKIIGIAPNQPKYRILAVDDVPASSLLLLKILSGIGFEVQEAGNGQKAVELWSSWHPDLILMDMRMPVMDGYEATRKIKSQPQGKKTIIIALTASAFEEEKVVILSAGCDDFMCKPFNENQLLEKIGQYLGINYLYEDTVDVLPDEKLLLSELTRESLTVMSPDWRSQLYDAAAKVDNQEILQLLSDIPEEYESLARGIEALVEHFRCDKILDLTKSVN